jgi:hypothetical protein
MMMYYVQGLLLQARAEEVEARKWPGVLGMILTATKFMQQDTFDGFVVAALDRIPIAADLSAVEALSPTPVRVEIERRALMRRVTRLSDGDVELLNEVPSTLVFEYRRITGALDIRYIQQDGADFDHFEETAGFRLVTSLALDEVSHGVLTFVLNALIAGHLADKECCLMTHRHIRRALDDQPH